MDEGKGAGTRLRPRVPAWRRYIPLAALLALATFALAMGWHRDLSFETLALNRDALREFVAANWLFALAAFAGIYIVVVALSLPGGAVLTISGGFLFGWLAGAFTSVVAATIGASVLFVVARGALGEALAARADPWLGRLRTGFQEDALNYMLFLRLVPAFPFWLVNLAPALLGVSLRVFVIGTFFGIIPGAIAYAVVGTGLDSVIDAQIAANPGCLEGGECVFRADPAALVTREILIALAALGIIALLPVIIKRLRARRHPPA